MSSFSEPSITRPSSAPPTAVIQRQQQQQNTCSLCHSLHLPNVTMESSLRSEALSTNYNYSTQHTQYNIMLITRLDKICNRDIIEINIIRSQLGVIQLHIEFDYIIITIIIQGEYVTLGRSQFARTTCYMFILM